jgi:hypothetical protein
MMLLLKARQACNALELCDPARRASPKLDEFEALVSEIAAQGSSKILVFSEWVEMLKLAGERLEALGLGHVMLHGGIPVDRRPALLDRFREQSDLRVLLSTDAGGVGLNLQVASYVVHLDLPWNPAKLDQRTARAHRLGQTHGVSVTYLCAEHGIERGIEGTLAVKRELRGAALDLQSDVDELEAPNFSAFMRQLRDVLQYLDEPESASEGEPGSEEIAADELALESMPAGSARARDGVAPAPGAGADAAAAAVDAGAAAPSAVPMASAPGSNEEAARGPIASACALASDRLRFARIVLEAGFPGDAVRAAYDALAAAIRALTDLPIDASHATLVAAIYRDLAPQGRVPPAAHAVLARLHDLTTLSAHNMQVDAVLAGHCVTEAEQWIARIGPEKPRAVTDINAPN